MLKVAEVEAEAEVNKTEALKNSNNVKLKKMYITARNVNTGRVREFSKIVWDNIPSVIIDKKTVEKCGWVALDPKGVTPPPELSKKTEVSKKREIAESPIDIRELLGEGRDKEVTVPELIDFVEREKLEIPFPKSFSKTQLIAKIKEAW